MEGLCCEAVSGLFQSDNDLPSERGGAASAEGLWPGAPAQVADGLHGVEAPRQPRAVRQPHLHSSKCLGEGLNLTHKPTTLEVADGLRGN